MSAHAERPLLEPLAPHERLSADDLAARAADEHLADALMAQQVRAAGGVIYRRGTCANCGGACHPRTVYCDPDCRADHEVRLRAMARRGG